MSLSSRDDLTLVKTSPFIGDKLFLRVSITQQADLKDQNEEWDVQDVEGYRLLTYSFELWENLYDIAKLLFIEPERETIHENLELMYEHYVLS